MKIRGLKIAEYVLYIIGLAFIVPFFFVDTTNAGMGALIIPVWGVLGIIFLICGFIIRQGSKNKSNY